MVQQDHLGVREERARRLLSIVVPTLNEAANLRRVDRALRAAAHEVIAVDDASSDGTADLAERIASGRANVRVLRRPRSERGVSSTILTGSAAARDDTIAVTDADLSTIRWCCRRQLCQLTRNYLDSYRDFHRTPPDGGLP
jgi:glycosyltransferase involved in cell wall biosynthesis